MNVLHVSPSFYPAQFYGGPIQSVYHLCCELPSHGCTVRILTTNANGMHQVIQVQTGVESELVSGVGIVYCRRWMRNAVSPALLKLLPSRVRWADVVHLTGVYSFTTFPTLLACRLFGKPLVWSPRGSLQKWTGVRRRLRKSIWNRACRAVAPRRLVLHASSDDELTESLQCFPHARGVVVPNGVQIPSTFTRTSTNGRLRLLYLGRLHPQKGIERLLKALVLLDTEGESAWSLTIVGPGSPQYVSSLESRIAGLGLGEKVRLVGEVTGEAKGHLFESSDLLVLPSYRESFGQVVVEALAHGVPVLASTGTPWKTLADRECGWWVDNEPVSLAEVIRQARGSPLREMGERGRRWMTKEFSWRDRAREMACVYRELVKFTLAVGTASRRAGPPPRDVATSGGAMPGSSGQTR